MNENRNDHDIFDPSENDSASGQAAGGSTSQNGEVENTGSSVYSYNYRDAQNAASHAGDYDAKRDDLRTQQNAAGAQAGGQNAAPDQGGYGNGSQSRNTYQNVNSYGGGSQNQSTYQNTGGYGSGSQYQNTYQNGNGYGNGSQGQNTYQNANGYGGGSQNQSSSDPGYQDAGQNGYAYHYQNTNNAGTQKAGGKKRRTVKKTKTRTRRAGGGFFQKKTFASGLAKCAIFAVVFGLIAGGIFYGVSGISKSTEDSSTAATTTSSSETSTTSVSTATTVTDVSDIVAEVMPAIVSITNVSETEYYSMFGSESETYESESAGSGIIVAEDDDYLYIATNNHVVDGYTYLTITFYDESTASADVKGTAASSDLAVVSVDKSTLEETTLSSIKIATLGDSTTLEVGEGAIAIGNALGYGQSVTTGVISALDREVTTTDSDTGISVTNSLIQTDAAINPGNSGGALLNMNGEVIGINSVKYSDTDVEGMGYAIPISTAQPIIDDLISQEKVDESKSAYLGISGVDLDSTTAETYGMPQGVYVVQVSEGSAAETGGLQAGDIITGFDDYTISSMEELQERMSYYEAGTEVVITVQRNTNGTYAEVELNVTLGSKN